MTVFSYFISCFFHTFFLSLNNIGGDITVTNENLPEYLDAQLQYRTMNRISDQLAEFLKGEYCLPSHVYFRLGQFAC